MPLEYRRRPSPQTAGAGERVALLQLERANGMLHERAPDAPVDFVMRLFAGAAPEDVLRYQPQELAELAAATWHFLADRAPRTAKIRVSNPDDGPRLKNVTVIELVNDDMPFLRRFRDGRARPIAASTPTCSCIRCSASPATRPASSSGSATVSTPRRCAKASSRFTSTASTMKPQGPRSPMRSPASSPTCASRCRTGARCSTASAGSSMRSRPTRRRSPRTRSPRPSPSSNGSKTTTSPSSAFANTGWKPTVACSPAFRVRRSACCAPTRSSPAWPAAPGSRCRRGRRPRSRSAA